MAVLVGLVGLVGAPLTVVVLTSPPAGALTTITVVNNSDAGAGSLRQAFLDASSGGPDAGDDVEIVIPVAIGNITLTTGELFYDGGTGGTHSLTLTGNGQTINQTTASSRVLDTSTTGLLTITELTLSGGNNAECGAGIFAVGSVTLTTDTITGNATATNQDGGGICTGGSGTVTVTNSTISHNTAAVNGGGLRAPGLLTVTNSTISDNTAGSSGGGILSGGVTFVYATVVGNTAVARANIFAEFGTTSLTSFGSVVALPPGGGANCGGLSSTTSNGFNFSDDSSCGFTAATDKQSAGDPGLGPLANNGGPTQTRLPQTGSPLVDAIPTGSCQADGASGIATDQRAVTRPQAGSCDVGAVEVGRFYTALTPARILDTRTSIGGHPSPLGSGQSLDLTVTGVGGVPASAVSAVVLNVTVTDTTAPSFLTAWPTGQPRPTASNLNWTPGETIPNLVQARVGTGGKVSMFNFQGSTDVVADVVGWYSNGTSATAAGFSGLAPARILDTRTTIGGHPAPLGSGQSLDLTVTGAGGVPATGVTAAVLNVTVTDTTAPSFLTVWPSGQPRPTASNLNWTAGETIPNLVVVKVGTGGKVSMFNLNGNTDVVADVVGWYSSGPTTGNGVTSLTPARILDTRTNLGGHPAPLGPGQSLDLTVTNAGGVPATGVTAAVLNVTVTDTTAPSFLTVWPSGQPRPTASNLNWTAGETIPNLVVVKVGTGGKVSMFNLNGNTDVVADVVGWF